MMEIILMEEVITVAIHRIKFIFKKYIIFLIFFLFYNYLHAQHTFDISTRIADNANLLSQKSKIYLQNELKNLDINTSHEFIIITTKSLKNQSIESYSINLARDLKLGKKDKNNGVMLLVAPFEKKVRIEVGYGLEGILTDIQSFDIIHNIILPEFKKSNYEKGILQGAKAIIKVLKNEPLGKNDKSSSHVGILFFISFVLFAIFSNLSKFANSKKNLLLYKISKAFYTSVFAGIFVSIFSTAFLSDFIFSSFIFTFIVCFILVYLKTKTLPKNTTQAPMSENFNDKNSTSSSFKRSSFKGGGGSFGGGGSSGGW